MVEALENLNPGASPWLGAPLPVAAAPPVIPRRHLGPCANAAVIGALPGSGGISRCILGNLDIDPFTQVVMDGGTLGLAGLITASVLVSMRIASPDDRRQLLIHETIAPRVLRASIVPQAEARGELEALETSPL